MERQLLLLTDYKGEYWVRHRHTALTTVLQALAEHLGGRGYKLRTLPFVALDLRSEAYRELPVLYQSSQDPGLYYKSYIEDMVLGLERAGARLLPRFELFRAHHNKVFMEVLRDLSGLPELQSLRARYFGTYEDLRSELHGLSYPAVLKLSERDTSRGVELLRDEGQARQVAEKLSRSFDLGDARHNLEHKLRRDGVRPHSFHRRKLIVQDFVPGLDHDYKIVTMADRFFVMKRPAPGGDFRASGSRIERQFPTELPEGLLDFTEKVFRHFDTPFASIDVMHDGARFYLGEIQFLRFGTGPIHRNPRHFIRQGGDGSWTCIEGRRQWEAELAHGIATHLDRH
ncbi:MAG: hypothetical protein OEZ06_31235 [Myxococcales bacterium]|nr:hypothetical protein [Myxococcales bacterium]